MHSEIGYYSDSGVFALVLWVEQSGWVGLGVVWQLLHLRLLRSFLLHGLQKGPARDGLRPASCFLLPARSPPLLCPGVEDDGVREQALVHVHALPALLMWNASAAR